MWPWAHAAVGYLLYVATARTQQYPLQGWPVYATLFGTQLPDLIDKPLAWWVPLLPAGRSFAHSLFVAALAILVAYYVFVVRRGDVASAVGLTIGYVSHIIGDGIVAIANGEWAQLSYLVWPLLPPPEYETDESLTAHLEAFAFDPWNLVGFAVTGVAIAVWLVILVRSRKTCGAAIAGLLR